MKFLYICTSFILGGVTGYYIGVKLGEKKAESELDDQIDAIRKAYEDHYNKNGTERVEERCEPKIQKTNSLDKPLDDEVKNYYDYSKPYRAIDDKPEDKKTTETVKKPYIISAQDFESSELEAESLYLYDDGILADKDLCQIQNWESLIGNNLLKASSLEQDVVYVRNESMKRDYEIIFQHSNFRTNCGTSHMIIGEDDK